MNNIYIAPTAIGDRITPEYLALQRQMHDLPYYGVSSSMWTGAIEDMIKEHGYKSVLDYGCGKGCLKAGLEHLADVEIREYDPAIPGKDGEPKAAQLLVCTDVLEHIEPERLPSVLEHMRTLGEMMFVVVATRPAIKTLPDGRNTHINLHDAEWWQREFSLRWDIRDWKVREGECIGLMKPYILIGEINGIGAVIDDIRNENVRTNISVTTRRLKPAKFVKWLAPPAVEPMIGYRVPWHEQPMGDGMLWHIPKPHARIAVLMCYGPSMRDTWEDALVQRASIPRADLISVSGAHDWLVDKGVIPDFHIECDPREHKGDMLHKPQLRTTYLMASCCHPNVIAKLKGYNITLWHLYNGEASEKVLEWEPGALMVPGGGSVGLRAIPLFFLLGYRRFIIHGMDCSFKDGESHAGAHTGKKQQPVEVRCTDGRKFLTAPVLITYQRYFDELRQKYMGDANTDPSKIEILLFGDGLLQHWLKVVGGATVIPATQEAAA